MYFSPWALPKDCYSNKAYCGALEAQFLQARDYCSSIKGLMKVNRAQKMNGGVECGSVLGTRGVTPIRFTIRKMSPTGNEEKKKSLPSILLSFSDATAKKTPSVL